MILNHNKEFFKNLSIVFGFWYLVLLVLSGNFGAEWSLSDLPRILSFGFLIILCGSAAGVVFYTFLGFDSKAQTAARIKGKKVIHTEMTIGYPVEVAPPEMVNLKMTDVASHIPKDLREWWEQYRKDYPAHAEVFRNGLAIMLTKPTLPAAKVRGGHGGATLIEHSFNVVRMMLKHRNRWTYTGHKDTKGNIVFGLIDMNLTEHRFQANDPLPELAALLHDIGKIVCYEEMENGAIKEVKPNHDIEGAALMRRVPAFMRLPLPDRDALLIALKYYHHISAIPASTKISDRARSLVELLYFVDVETGKQEGGTGEQEQPEPEMVASSEVHDVAGAELDPADLARLGQSLEAATGEGAAPASNEEAESSVNQTVAEEADEPTREQSPARVPDAAKPDTAEPRPAEPKVAPEPPHKSNSAASGGDKQAGGTTTPKGTQSKPRKKPSTRNSTLKVIGEVVQEGCTPCTSEPPDLVQGDDEYTPLDAVRDILTEGPYFNKTNVNKRAALKHGDLVFLFDATLRSIIETKNADKWRFDPSDLRQPNDGVTPTFTKYLAWQLQELGALFNSFNGYVYSYREAFWKVQVSGKKDSRAAPYVIVFSASKLLEAIKAGKAERVGLVSVEAYEWQFIVNSNSTKIAPKILGAQHPNNHIRQPEGDKKPEPVTEEYKELEASGEWPDQGVLFTEINKAIFASMNGKSPIKPGKQLTEMGTDGNKPIKRYFDVYNLELLINSGVPIPPQTLTYAREKGFTKDNPFLPYGSDTVRVVQSQGGSILIILDRERMQSSGKVKGRGT